MTDNTQNHNQDKNQLPLEQLRQIRIEKAEKLRKLGIDPYPSKSNRTKMADDVLKDFSKLENKEVTIAGRLVSFREHGGLAFGHVRDESGQVQLYIKKDVLEKTNPDKDLIGFDELNLFDVGDLIEATGEVTKTQRGEVSILTREIRMLAKSIRPLPDKHDGIKDQEVIHRKRYLDLIVNPESRYRFQKRAEVTFAIRKFLNEKGFFEIKTPILQPLYGGGLAKPFSTHVNSLDVDFYMAISHELYLKRLITAGFEKVYNIAGYFRNEGIDRTHNPEFEMLETMTAFENYEYNMDLLEEMYKYIGKNVFGKMKFKVGGHEVDISKRWKRQMMVDAVKEYTGHDFSNMKLEEAHKILKSYNLEELPQTVGECMVKAFEEKVEEKLIQPTIIFGHPVEISPLAKKMKSNPKYVERFELFLGGIETGDNWSELNDPIELFERFKEQAQKRKGGDLEAHQMDIDFIETMEYGMPPTTGLGPGIERLVMLFTETEYIDDVIFFPIMKPKEPTDFDKKVYGIVETPKAKPKKGASNSTNYSIQPELLKDFPGFSYAYVIISDVDIKKGKAELKNEIDKTINEIINKFADKKIKEIPTIAAYRMVTKATGTDPDSKMPSPQALLKRVLTGKGLYNINNAVDAYNLAVLQTQVGLGGFDYDKTEEPFILRYSNAGEKMHLLGDDEESVLRGGQVIYADAKGPTTVDINYRDIDRTKITLDTKNVILFADGSPGITEDEILSALKLGAEYIQKYCGGKIGEYKLVNG